MTADLLAFAEYEFSLNAKQDDGVPLREHLESEWRQTGIKPHQLEDAPELPELAAHLWLWFIEMHNERGSNGMEVSKITSTAMKDWCWATGNSLELWERTAIRKLDVVALKK